MNVRLKHTMLFTAGVYYGGEMRMNNYHLTLNMLTNTHDGVSHQVAFERIKYFVYSCMDSTIFINQAQQDKCKQFVSAGFNITTMPGEPVDQLIGLMLYYKLNAIMEDRIIVEETEISSSLGENMIYLHSENEITDINNYPDWWTTMDPIHSDYMIVDSEKVVSMHASTAWRELDLLWPDTQFASETGNIVVFRDFTPANETK